MSTRRPDDPPARRPKARRPRRTVVGMLGLGLDNQDGHTRVTRGPEFLLLGGSAETHERMKDFSVRLTERLRKKGKKLSDATPRELRDLADDLGT